MAYSQVEVASCVLKEHNRRERCNAFQKNLKELVRDHLCISVSSAEDETSQNHQNLTASSSSSSSCITNCQDDNKNSGKEATNLDRWAAKQAEEMVSTLERHEEESLLASSSSKGLNVGASTLVQMWEARLQPAHIRVDRCNSYKNSPKSAVGATSTGIGNNNVEIIHPNPSEDLAGPGNNNEITSSASSSTRTSGVNEDLFVGLGESERVRIADIIKKLKSDNENEQGSTSVCDPSPRRISDAADPKSFSLVVNVNSLKIRGRQAFNDLLLHMEQERQRELTSIVDRHSVSKFAHRGRIQSMLRVRSLQRGMAIQNLQREQYHSAQSTTPSHANRSSSIMSLRERFSRGIGDDGTNSLTPKSGKEIENNNNSNNSIVSNENQVIKSNHCGDISVRNQQATTSKSCCKEIEANKNDHNRDQASKSGKDNCTVNYKDGSTIFQVMINKDSEQQADSLSQTSEVLDDVHEESSARSDVTWQGTSSEVNNFEPTPSIDNWEENEMDGERYFEGGNYDWFSDIARPRSYWEDLRKGWYEQMLTCSSEDNEIKRLLERKTVSSFLASDFRAKMDQMIESHVQIQASQEDEELEEEGQERMGQLIMSFLQRQSHAHSHSEQEQQPREDVDADADADDEEEEEQQVATEEAQSAFSSWNYIHHDHQQVTPPDSEQQPSEASNNHQLTTQEVDLRGQMQQLQREMYELRKAMQACLEMQSQLRKEAVEVKPEQAARNPYDITRKERKCCICYDKQVDTFLYRCGHMCTCLRCAHELQWSSGKCPICRAPILDVVRAYMD